MSKKEEYTTKFLPEFLKNLDTMLQPGQLPANHAKLTAAEYLQIALQLKTCELLNEIKYELKTLEMKK